jgi:hypothetical protein
LRLPPENAHAYEGDVSNTTQRAPTQRELRTGPLQNNAGHATATTKYKSFEPNLMRTNWIMVWCHIFPKASKAHPPRTQGQHFPPGQRLPPIYIYIYKTLTFLEVSDYSGLTSTQYLTGEDCGDRDKFKGIFTPRRPGTTYLVRVSSTPI